MTSPLSRLPWRISLLYAMLGALWILLTDRLLLALVTDPALLTRLQTFKGGAFVAVTSLLLYLALRKQLQPLQGAATARKMAEDAAAAKQAELAGIIASAMDGIITVNSEQRVVLFNAAAEQMFGYRAADVLGTPLERLLPERLRAGHTQHIRGFGKTGVTGRRMGELGAISGLRSNGDEFPIEASISQLDIEHTRYFTVILRDITLRLQAAAKLSEREALLHTLTSRAHVGMVMVTAEHRYVFANAAYAELLCLPTADIVGQQVAQVLAPVYENQIRARLDRAFSGERVAYELVLPTRPDGEGERCLAVSYDPPVDTVHGPCVIVVLVDVSERKRADDALREREASERERRTELETVMAAIPVAVFIAQDASCERITGNPAAMELLRMPLGRNPSANAPESERADYQSWSRGRWLAPHELPMQRATASGKPVRDAELDVVFVDGQTRHLLGSALPLFDDAGTVRGCVGAFVDISERRRRERNLDFLAELQRLFAPLTATADILHVAGEQIAKHLSLTHCLLTEIDDTAEHAVVLHDHHSAEVVALEGVFRIADFQTDAERHAMQAGAAVMIDDVHLDARAETRVQQFEALGIASLVNAPYLAKGRWRFLLSALRDKPHAWSAQDAELLSELAARLYVRIERSRAEEQLRASEERMRLAAEAAQFGMYDRDMRGSSFHVSPEFKQLLGHRPETPLDRDQARAQIHPDDREAGEKAFERACDPDGDGRVFVEQRILRADGAVRWISIVGQVLFKDGAPERSIGFLVDITERKEAEGLRQQRNEELRVAAEVALASKYKSEFLANMSHELRTPLNSLLILSQLLAENRERNLTPRQVEFAEVMHQSGTDLLRLINEILDLSRIEAGQVEVYVESVALAVLAQKLESQFRPIALSKPIDFSVSVDPALPATMRSDASRIEQVLRNLLANAFKFTASGRVTLAMSRASNGWSQPHPGLDSANGVVAFAVSDSGIGIAPDKQRLIFEAFRQADGSTSRKYGGTGLGLSISREIAALLGGAITLTSEPGVGSTFTLYLPYTHKAVAAAGKTMSSGHQAVTTRAVDEAPDVIDDDRDSLDPSDDVLLLIENDANFARLLLDIAHRHHFKGLVATSSSAALHLARRHRPCALTLSVTLPDMDGWQLLQCIGDDLSIRHIPVHIVSGDDQRPRGLRHGAVSYLQKPVTEAALGALFDRIKARKERVLSKVLLIEDDRAMQVQLQEVIGASSTIETTVVASAEEGLNRLRAQGYDCIVLDLRLPGMTGFEFLEAVRDQLAIDDLPIVVYTGLDLSEAQQARLKQLAESVLIKDADSIELLLDEVVHYLHCPLDALAEPVRQMIERLHSGARTLAGSKVLVVDDDMRNVYAVLSILEGAGIEVVHAENGLRCLELLQSVPDIQAVLMDIMMPGMDGYEATRRVRQMPGLERLPVIALTARAMKGDREKCLAAGASDYLTKPVDGVVLLARLDLWIRR